MNDGLFVVLGVSFSSMVSVSDFRAASWNREDA